MEKEKDPKCRELQMDYYTVPAILPKRNARDNTSYAVKPLRNSLSQFQQANPIERFEECIICIIHHYDESLGMLADAFVIPYRFSGGKKAVSALKLIARGKIRVSDIGLALRNAQLSPNEERVLHLVRQTPLSTAELARCFEKNIRDVSSSEKVISGIYPEEELDQEHIANEEALSEQSKVVLEAVSNLYLRRQVILELP